MGILELQVTEEWRAHGASTVHHHPQCPCHPCVVTVVFRKEAKSSKASFLPNKKRKVPSCSRGWTRLQFHSSAPPPSVILVGVAAECCGCQQCPCHPITMSVVFKTRNQESWEREANNVTLLNKEMTRLQFCSALLITDSSKHTGVITRKMEPVTKVCLVHSLALSSAENRRSTRMSTDTVRPSDFV